MTACGSFLELKRRALRGAIPLIAHLELTHACTWRCRFCSNPPRRHPELDGDEWLAVLDDLRRLGTLFVVLTGGEPLLHQEFARIARGVGERRLAFRLLTNGSLVDESSAALLGELRPLSVELSLHGATAATHDRTTRTAGSFDAVWRAVDLLRRHHVRLLLKMPITRLNAGEVDEALALARAAELPLRVDPTITPRDDGDPRPLDLAADGDQLRSVFARLEAAGELPEVVREAGGANCGLGRLTVAVDPAGDVYPCIQWRHESMGSVRERRLRDIWAGSEVRARAAEAAELANRRLIEGGDELARAPYCPAVAVRHSGDPLVPDAVFLDQARAAHEVRRSRS